MKTEQEAALLLSHLRANGQHLATAESCTGGGIGHILTSISGSSSVYLGGVISYTNEVKEKLLHVPHETISEFSAVSPQTAKAMAEGCRQLFSSDLAISVTGIAGPGTDERGNPVGLVFIGISTKAATSVQAFHFQGTREEIRAKAISSAIHAALSAI